MTEAQRLSYADLTRGDLFPWATIRDAPSVKFGFHTLGGRYLVFCFFGSAGDPGAEGALAALGRHRPFFDDTRACFFGIGLNADDKDSGRVQDSLPGVRFFFDQEGDIGRACGALPMKTAGLEGSRSAKCFWLVVDPTFHVVANIPFGSDPGAHDEVFRLLRSLPSPERHAGFDLPVPVLVLPNVFEQQLCRQLIGLYDQNGGSESGIYRAGQGVNDHSFKRRKDFTIEDAKLIQLLQGKIRRRVIPEIERIFFTKITRMERYIVGCYAAEDNAHFRPHRDNGPGLTAHRRFAVSINLSDDFDGGEVSFPEYGPRGIKAPQGWAVVFPAAILHAVSLVTYGRRYAFLPFVYDEGGAKIRDAELARYHSERADEAQVA